MSPKDTSRPFDHKTGSITLRPKALKNSPRDYARPDFSASEVSESQQVEIPNTDVLCPDWRRPSQERDDDDTHDDMMPIPSTKTMDEDWKITVQKAFNDVSRTKAPCEIPADEVVQLPNTTSKRIYGKFVEVLHECNPKTPTTIIENMASIFAKSGRMTTDQAQGSYSFEVKAMEMYGLFVPTNFRSKPPFDGNDSNVYHIIHGTTTKGASTILAEELIRPGDFTIHRALAQCGYPSYGYYSAGVEAAKTIRFSNNIEELSRKILKVGKGTLPVQIAGIYTGRFTHSTQNAGGNDEVQRLCGKNGVAKGKEKYTVARSECTTVIGVILYYKNEVDQPARNTETR